MTVTRYAIYYAPDPADGLWRFGSSVLGYDAAAGTPVAPFVPAGLPAARWAELTAEPRRYGFHATIKAPFRLAEGQTEEGLLGALAAFAAGRRPTDVELAVRRLGGFVALVPAADAAPVAALERAAVVAFEPYRAPLTPDEIARRLASGLSPRQAELLHRYGYPYVRDEFRFHMTFTGALPDALGAAVTAALEAGFREAVPSSRARIGGLCLFRQQDAASRFRIIARYPFGAPVGRAWIDKVNN